MNHKLSIAASMALALSACSTTGVRNALGTPKNPPSVLSVPARFDSKIRVNPFVEANYRILLEATELSNNNQRTMKEVGPDNIKRYLGAGFALADYYCEGYFKGADESQRRRKFGRSVFNDVGTTMATVLGLANAGENVVTGVAAGFGLGDSSLRNYDEAFVVSPDLANVRSLVMAALENFRERSLGEKAKLPKNYGTAQSVVMQYAGTCSTLGMRSLLAQSSTQQRKELLDDAEEMRKPGEKGAAGQTSAETSNLSAIIRGLSSTAAPQPPAEPARRPIGASIAVTPN